MLTILLVDDENVNLKLLEEYISVSCKQKELDCKIIKAYDGNEGYALYKKHKPNFIISDIKMPHCDGVTMITNIRKDDLDTKITLLTAYKDIKVLTSLITSHINYFIAKPFSLSDISIMMENLLKEKDRYSIISHESMNLPDDYVWKFDSQVLMHDYNEVKLTKKEKIILSTLLKRRNQLVPYIELKDNLWENDPTSYSRDALKTVVNTLRGKVPVDLIKNVYGLGYKIEL